MALPLNPLPQAKRTKRKPITDIYDNQRRIDREAFALAERDGITFPEAWKRILDREQS